MAAEDRPNTGPEDLLGEGGAADVARADEQDAERAVVDALGGCVAEGRRAALRLVGGSSDMEGSYALIFSMGALDLLPSSSSVYPYP